MSPTIYTFPISTCSSEFIYDYHACALAINQQIKCWGRNNGNLGYGDTEERGDELNEIGDYLPFVPIQDIISVSTGRIVTCAYLSSLQVKCWGGNAFGQLGQESTNIIGNDPNELGDYLPPIDFGTGVSVSYLHSSYDHSCVITSSNDLKCWGYNESGRLGYGDTASRGNGANEMGNYLTAVDLGTSEKARSITLGEEFTCALLVSGYAKCWGKGTSGQLGQEDTFTKGNWVNELGDNLPPIDLGPGLVVSKIFSGYDHNCALFDDQTVKLWGNNDDGQLGIGSTSDKGDDPKEMGTYLSTSNLGTSRTVLEVCLGESHSCMILDNFELKCFGQGDYGQLGYGDNADRGDGSGEMGDNLPNVNVGSGLTSESIHCGKHNTCVIFNDDSFKCWGINGNGQLGQGDTQSRGNDPNELGDYLPPINLGTGFEIQECFDYSPSSSPTFTLSPSYQPSFQPTLFPSQSFMPTLNPSTISPSLSLSPTQSPTFGVHFLGGDQNGGGDSDEIYEMVVDSDGSVIVGGDSDSDPLFGFANKGNSDFFMAKYRSNLTFYWGWSNGSSSNDYGLMIFCCF